ncbi:MAG TPA: DUF305 domain-containing protein [Longimicrobium sp.]|nr:DUF305 domain-containing protein [Longimicrobium sp.]
MERKTPKDAGPLILLLAAAAVLFAALALWLYLTNAEPGEGSAEAGFARDMSVHHAQAVEMAEIVRDKTRSEEIRLMAADMALTQQGQIGRMQGWLGLWGAAADPPGGRHMAWMASSPDTHAHATMASGGVDTMPGMATSDQLRALRAASGEQMDVLFLQLMLRHHEGGVIMLQYASEHASVTEVRNLAAQMLSSQTSESEYLKQLLAARGGTPLPL